MSLRVEKSLPKKLVLLEIRVGGLQHVKPVSQLFSLDVEFHLKPGYKTLIDEPMILDYIIII